MKKPLFSLLAGWFALAPGDGDAQTANAAKVPTRDEVVALSPFEVNTSRDTSYGALNSTSISAFNTPLLKTPVAADIFTEEFMRDVGTTTIEDLLNGYGAGVGDATPTVQGDSGNLPGDRPLIGSSTSRGVTTGATRRSGFVMSPSTANSTDTFDTERVEVIKGANAMLFGASGAGGFANTTSKQARFGMRGSPLSTATISWRVDQYGSQRGMIDANYGLKNLAFRLVVMKEELNQRRLFIGARTHAIYGTMSARLPFNTTLRLSLTQTDTDRITPVTVGDVSFTNATRDPRHLYSLSYLLATNQTGAGNPKTGAAYPGGALANGSVNWSSAYSWGGWAQEEDTGSTNGILSADTVWTKWLATSVAAMYDFAPGWRASNGGTLLAPRAFNSANPLDEWASSSNFSISSMQGINTGIRKGFRANAVTTLDLLNGKAKTQSVLGFDYNSYLGGSTSYSYYEADSNFVLFDRNNPRPAALGGVTGANLLGRIAMGTLYWPVGSGPVKRPNFKPGSARVTVNGRNYLLLQDNPRNPDFVSPLNPLGLLSLVPGYSGIGGGNLRDSSFLRDTGFYGANYTRWFDDRFTTLIGYRLSNSYSRTANASTTGKQPWNVKDVSNMPSYNLGLSYRIKSWLYSYYNFGRTFLPANRSPDPYGEPAKDTAGRSHEIGFKYEPADGAVSGSISYYFAQSKNETFNYGAGNRDLINPVGLNDAFNAAERNQWIPVDKKSSGLEVILTAAPTRNWRARLGFTQQDGKINTNASYPMLWNDEFHYNKSTGGVTYADGTPFMVPTDPAGVAAVNSTNTLRAPVVGATNTQLTVAMMSDRTSPYYAYGLGGTTETNGRIRNNSVLFRALRWFQISSAGQNIQARTLRNGLPLSAIPYAYDDPAGYDGVAVIAESGEPTIGHPLYRFVFTNTYVFSDGRMRGVTIGGTVRWNIDKRTYWYTEPDGQGRNIRKLYQESDVNPQVSSFISYRRKVGRLMFSTQVNVNNLFNKYKVEVRPGGNSGYTLEDALAATFIGEPRQYVWTNTVSY